MAGIKLSGLLGEFPALNKRKLPVGAASTAANCFIEGGEIRPIKNTNAIHTLNPAGAKSVYFYEPLDGTDKWFESTSEVQYVRWPLGDDEYDRVVYSSPSFSPRITSNDLAGVTTGEPDDYYDLGIPAPTIPPTATVNGVQYQDDIPEVRYYVYTYVNIWGQESPPSPVSNQVEVSSGQYVYLTNMGSLPTGDHNITHRRIYRANTSTTGRTIYQFVAELRTASGTFVVVNAVGGGFGQGSPNTTLTFVAAHDFAVGDTLYPTGVYGSSGAPVGIDDIVYGASTTKIVSVGHGFSNLAYVNITGLTGDTGGQELNNLRTQITRLDDDNFTLDALDGVDTQGYTAWNPTLGTGTYVQRSLGAESFDNFASTRVVEVLSPTSVVVATDTSGDNPINGSGFIGFGVAGGSNFYDHVLSSTLLEQLPSALWDPPNPGTWGIKAHPGRFLVGHYDNTIAFSDSGAPHGWPLEYRQSTDGDITGTGIFGNYIFVGTTKQPYLLFGNTPDSMTMQELPAHQACVSARGIVDYGQFIVYPSPDGLMLVTNGVPQNITKQIFTRRQWNALNPSTFNAYNWEGLYLCAYGDGNGVYNSFAINPLNPEMGMVQYPDWFEAGFYHEETDILYLGIGTELVQWDNAASDRTFTYKSRLIRMNKPTNFSLMRVLADNYPVTIKVQADDRYQYEVDVHDDHLIRMPADYRGLEYKITIKSKNPVAEVSLGTSVKDFAEDVA